MDHVVQFCAIAVISAVCICIIRPQSGALSAVLSAVACILILILAFQFFRPIIELLKKLETLSGLSAAATAPMMKVTGIGILCQISGSVCEDAGEKTLSQAVQMAGSVLSVYVSLPLLSAVLDLLGKIMGG